MTSKSPVDQEKYIHKEFSKVKVKVTNSMQIFCKYLIDSALTYGRYYYPSLNTFKFDEKLSLSSRTIDRLVRPLVQVNFLTKFPRSKTQAYQVNIKNPLFHLILRIYYPVRPIIINIKQETASMQRIEELQNSKEHLKYILNYLESEEDYILELHGNLLNEIAESTNVSNTAKDALKESLRSTIIEYCKSTEINKFSILNDFLQENNKRD